MNGLPYYKRYPRDFIEGTISMPFELKAAYSVVLDLIYMQGGKLPDDARYIAGLLGVSVRRWNAFRTGLIEARKIVPDGGYLTNYRAIIELESLAKLQDQQREKRLGWRKNKDLGKPQINHTEPEPDTYIERVDKSTLLSPADDISEAVLIYNSAAKRQPTWAVCQTVNKQRRSRLAARLKQVGGIDGWKAAIAKAEASPFLRGEVNDFRLGLDFLLQESSMTKLTEGLYDGRKAAGNKWDKY